MTMCPVLAGPFAGGTDCTSMSDLTNGCFFFLEGWVRFLGWLWSL
jgi:hypothetical protein